MEEVKSKVLNNAVEQLSSLPGVGKKTALRLCLSMLKWPKREIEKFAHSFHSLANDLKVCTQCYNYADLDLCDICLSHNRQSNIICVVEDIRDLMAIENTNAFKGVYHVLGSLISPLEGIGPDKLRINELVQRLEENEITEIIFGLNSTIEGETTAHYIYNKIKDLVPSSSTLARGIAFHNDLEYTDQLTLGKSIENRTPFA